jgi:hypothetical protein
MKKFKEFLEDYDVYIDKPMGFKKVEPEVDELEVTDTEDENQEESDNQGVKATSTLFSRNFSGVANSNL